MSESIPHRRQLEEKIGRAMSRDRFRLRRALKSIFDREMKKSGKSANGGKWKERSSDESVQTKDYRHWSEKNQTAIASLADEIEASVRKVEARAKSVPKPRFDVALPVVERREEIARTIRQNQVVIVCGETGSGKSTQLPKICLTIGRGIDGVIGHTQPRRIAARSVANRIASELDVSLGSKVGYKMRLDDRTGDDTYIKIMTDGILLAETQSDRFLDQYDTLIIDEAHERSLNIDFLLGYIKRLLPRRPNLKVIVTSATIDAARFAEFFSDHDRPAPVIEVAGRTYPVDLRYRPYSADMDDTDTPNRLSRQETTDAKTSETEPDTTSANISDERYYRTEDTLEAVVEAVEEVIAHGPGDLLVFMPTERDIHEAVKVLRTRLTGGSSKKSRVGPAGIPVDILPLYARLPGNVQQQIFRTEGKRRRIVIATNVAESSVTVPGIKYVIDTGTARISRYSPSSRTQRLPIEPVSRASADQRKGRCGRIAPGICVRLYSRSDFESRPAYTMPEIQRSNLSAVILQAKSLRLGPIERFPLMDPPRRAAIRDGEKTLFELGAIDDRGELTDIGWRLSRLPVDPRIGRMILAADDFGCVHDVITIAAALEIRDPRERPFEHRDSADRAHAKFADERSDFLTLLKMWDFYQHLKETLSRSRLAKACRENFLSLGRLREWGDIRLQLVRLIHGLGLKEGKRRGDEDAIHQAILTGLLSGIARRGRMKKHPYDGTGGSKQHLWPGSATFEDRPEWVVAAESVETSKHFLRTVAPIDPKWIEPLADHLVKRTYSDPKWNAKSGGATVVQRVSLFGLTIVAGRRVPLGPLDPSTARELMIRHGLVEGDIRTRAPFYSHNIEVLEEVATIEDKLRRRGLVRGDAALEGYYLRNIPEDVCDVRQLENWYKKASRGNPGLLRLTVEELLTDIEAARFDPTDLPDRIVIGDERCGATLDLDYAYEPGTAEDGLHLTVPVGQLPSVGAARLEWLVPGRLVDKIVALIRTLPKSLRRPFAPAPDVARVVASQLKFGEGDLTVEVARRLSEMSGDRITAADFDRTKIPPELQMIVHVVDADDKVIASGRDIEQLRRESGDVLTETLAAVDDSKYRRDGITSWDFDERLPESASISAGGGRRLTAFPALIDHGDSVSLEPVDSPERAERLTRRGVVRLFTLKNSKQLRQQIHWMPEIETMRMQAATIAGFKTDAQLVTFLAWRAVHLDDRPAVPRDRDAFDRLVKAATDRIGPAIQELTLLLPPLFAEYHRARLAIAESNLDMFGHAHDDTSAQLDRLTGVDFLIETPSTWLRHYPRYFKAITARLDSLRTGALQRDRISTDEIRELEARLEAYLDENPSATISEDPSDPLVEYRWMLEEYRVSLFAQSLGTSVKVSAKRLERQWEKVLMSR